MAVAEANVRACGWEPVRGPHVLARNGYLAGTDAERLADVQWALDAPDIDGVWVVRGGYGLTRIVGQLALDRFVRAPKALIGYSDVTALHCAVAARAAAAGVAVVTFHAHTARAVLPAMSVHSLCAAVGGRGEPCGVWTGAEVVRDGVVRGRLAGGNVALLAALCGTPWALRGEGAIIVLEDVNEAAYRVDRMFRQLEQGGVLRGCAGLAVGQFTNVPEDEHAGASTIGALVAELADRLGVPCLANLPIGHIPDQWTLPLGAEAVLDVAARSLVIADAGRGIPVS